MFQMLEVIICFATIYLILSMILKYVMTAVKRLLKTKANVIAEAMQELIGEKTAAVLIPLLEQKAESSNLLQSLGLRRSSQKGLRWLSKADLEKIIGGFTDWLKKADITDIANQLGIDKDVENLSDGIKQHIEHLNQRITAQYDRTMKRIEEYYEGKMRILTLYAGITMALIVNADFFEIYHSLSTDSLVRATVASRADAINEEMRLRYDYLVKNVDEGIEDWEQFQEENRKAIEEMYDSLGAQALSMGWRQETLDELFFGGKRVRTAPGPLQLRPQTVPAAFVTREPLTRHFDPDMAAIVKKIIGLIVSGLLISFGAPFWHDLLSSVTSLKRMLREKRTVDTES